MKKLAILALILVLALTTSAIATAINHSKTNMGCDQATISVETFREVTVKMNSPQATKTTMDADCGQVMGCLWACKKVDYLRTTTKKKILLRMTQENVANQEAPCRMLAANENWKNVPIAA